MEYQNRKICGLINLHSTINSLRCPQIFDSKACKDSPCDGCELFEIYLKFRRKSIELKEKTCTEQDLERKMNDCTYRVMMGSEGDDYVFAEHLTYEEAVQEKDNIKIVNGTYTYIEKE